MPTVQDARQLRIEKDEARPPRVITGSLLREKELWLLVLIGLAYFYRPLFFGETFFFRDLNSYFLPQKQMLSYFFKEGELPLWNPFIHGGQAYLASIANSALYPSNILHLLLPPARALVLDIFLHFVLCLVFSYLFSRVIGLQRISSFVAAVVFGFCGYTISLVNLHNYLVALPYLPMIFFCWHLYLSEKKTGWFIAAVLGGVMQVFAGAPESTCITLLSLLGWTIAYPYSTERLFQRVSLWLVLTVFIIGISSVQTVPTAEIGLRSFRFLGMDFSGASQWSLNPRRLPEIVLPGFLGNVDVLPEQSYWGSGIVDMGVPYIISIYFGLITLFIGIAGGLGRHGNHALPFRVRVFLLSLFAFSLFLSLGRFIPFFEMLYDHIPLIRLFRYPEKFLNAGILPLALLAGDASGTHFGGPASDEGAALQEAGSPQRRPSAKILAFLWTAVLALLIFFFAIRFSDGFADFFQRFVFKLAGDDAARRGVGLSALHAAGTAALLALLYHYRRWKIRPWQHWFLAAILSIDLIVAGTRVNPTAPEELFGDVPPSAGIIRKNIGDGRLYRDEDAGEITLRVPTNDISWKYRFNFEVLRSYANVLFGIPAIFHTDIVEMTSVYMSTLKQLVDFIPWDRRLPLFAAGGVTVILSHHELSIPGIERIAQIPNVSDRPAYVYKVTRPGAKVGFVTEWETVDSDLEAFDAMTSHRFDPGKKVILHADQAPARQGTDKPQDAASGAPETAATIIKVEAGTDAAVYSVSNDRAGHLVFSEPFYPGWRIYVDGERVKILRANYAFSAVFLPAGKHVVCRKYRPGTLLVGAACSTTFFILLLLFPRWRRLAERESRNLREKTGNAG